MRTFFVYIMANEARTVYVGVTNDLERRVWEHRNGSKPGFTKRHGLKKLVYVEDFESPIDAIQREKQLKSWRRSKKVELIHEQNPHWNDLARDWY